MIVEIHFLMNIQFHKFLIIKFSYAHVRTYAYVYTCRIKYIPIFYVVNKRKKEKQNFAFIHRYSWERMHSIISQYRNRYLPFFFTQCSDICSKQKIITTLRFELEIENVLYRTVWGNFFFLFSIAKIIISYFSQNQKEKEESVYFTSKIDTYYFSSAVLLLTLCIIISCLVYYPVNFHFISFISLILMTNDIS